MISLNKLKKCFEKLNNKKILPHKSSNILKDVEFDEQMIFEEICKNLDD